MAGIVKNWITNKLGLEVRHMIDPHEFQSEVANGILIAEILRKYCLLSDDEFVSLRHNNSVKSRRDNMAHVHRWLTKAGMNLDRQLITDIATEMPGSALKFLYELFLWLENGPRKPNVGDKAKKYLTQTTAAAPIVEVPQGEKKHSRDERMSVLSSTWLHSKKSQEVEATDKTLETTKAHSSRTRKQRNWYTTLDPPNIRQHSHAGPFSGLSETAQAESIYFTNEIIETVKNQPMRVPKIDTSEHKGIQNEEPVEPMHKLKFRTREEIIDDRKARVKREEVAIALQEIRKFDKKLEKKKREGVTSGDLHGKVYWNGKGDQEHLQNHLQQLKCKREKEEKATIERNRCRKQAMNRITEAIPKSMTENMQNDILKMVFSLSTNERTLADFIYNGHQEKVLFKQHAYYETIQKQRVRDFDLAKSQQIQQEEKDLKRVVLECKYERPERPATEEPTEEEIRQSVLLDKLLLVDSVIENVLDVVTEAGDRRMAMSSILTGTEGMEKPDTDELNIILRDEEVFMLDPSQWPEDLELAFPKEESSYDQLDSGE